MSNYIKKMLLIALFCAIPKFIHAEQIQTDIVSFTNQVYIGDRLQVGDTNKTLNPNNVQLKVIGTQEVDILNVETAITIPNGTESNSPVTLHQLQDANIGTKSIFMTGMQTLDFTNSISPTNWTFIAIDELTNGTPSGTTNVPYGATNIYTFVQIYTNQSFTRLDGGIAEVEWFCSENLPNSATHKPELYLFNTVSSQLVEFGENVTPQLVATGLTPQKQTFSITYPAITTNDPCYLAIRGKNISGTASEVIFGMGPQYLAYWRLSIPNSQLTAANSLKLNGQTGDYYLNTANHTNNVFTGNVGIGTNVPAAKLHVAGNILTSNLTVMGSVSQGVSTATNVFMGEVGIGTANPSIGTLDILTSVNHALRLRARSADDLVSIEFSDKAGGVNPWAHIQAVSTRDLIFQTGASGITESMRILSNGNVGIGTNAPAAELVVVDADATAGQVILYGGATSPGLSLYHQLSGAARRNWGLRTEQNIQGDFSILESASSSASPSVTRLTILSGGNVGIGTSSPSNKLEVAGTFQATKMTNTIIDESCTFQGSSYTPYPVISSYSNGILLVNGNYQKIVCTNNVGTNYFDIPVTNKSAFLLLEVDKGTNSLSFYTDNLTTNGLGSINSITLTNSGITSIQFYFPCAGTNLGLKWKAYQF